MAELLFEILSEEIPARMQAYACSDLHRLVTDGLTRAGLSFEAARAYVTPRRLTLVVEGLPAAAPDTTEERRGPRVGAPGPAMDGFLKSTGLAIEQLEKRDTGKGEFWFALIEKKGRPAIQAAQDAIETALTTFPWPKSMRWGSGSVRWVRPVLSILCLFDGAVVPVGFGAVTAGNVTRGHRFQAPDPIVVKDFAGYLAALENAKVMLDPVERRHAILSQAEALAEAEGLTLRADPGLLDEVTGLVEWPNVLIGTIDETFMAVPPEVLITSMRSHQKYFSLLKADGSLAPRFLVVSNMTASAAIVAGNQRVLRARLSDAAFFWETDRKATLCSRLPKLIERLFYAKLGTVADKVERIAGLARHLTFYVPGSSADDAERAALLAKADLSTEMVGEFPELQGVMGRYYALNDHEKPAVAQAIADHYAPQGPSEPVPAEPLGICVALADKIDSLVGFFAIGEKPTGSKDPFALRRQALGVIRIIVENRLRLPLIPFFNMAHAAFGGGLDRGAEDTTADLLGFFADRLEVHLRERGIRHDLIAAVLALGAEDDLIRLLSRVAALRDFLDTDDGANLLAAYKRAMNIVRIEDKKDGASRANPLDPALLTDPAERDLAQALAAAGPSSAQAVKSERFGDAMTSLAQLRKPLDAFFTTVTVNADDPKLRNNRLRLLSEIGIAMGRVADFGQIEN